MNLPVAITVGIIGIGAIVLMWHMIDKGYTMKAGNVELHLAEHTYLESNP